jgi:hypothetical protein
MFRIPTMLVTSKLEINDKMTVPQGAPGEASALARSFDMIHAAPPLPVVAGSPFAVECGRIECARANA